MFGLCRPAVFICHQWTVKSSLTLRLSFPPSYSTSAVRLGAFRKINDKYERFLERRFPRFYILYHTLTKGFKLLFEDVKEVRRIRKTLRSNNFHYRALPYRDLERLILFRRDMIKAVPLLVISLPPFAIFLMFILMCLFPRQLLFRHFWTPQQQRKFQEIYHQKRSRHQAAILQNLMQSVSRVKELPQRMSLHKLCQKVHSGTHPSVSELHELRDVFSDPPLGLNYMEYSLLRPLGAQLPTVVWMPSFLLRRRLSTKALDLLNLDFALNSLGLDQLSDEELRRACDLRGLDSGNLGCNECKEWLHQWLVFSLELKESETSLLLHSMPILALNYPQPTNGWFWF